MFSWFLWRFEVISLNLVKSFLDVEMCFARNKMKLVMKLVELCVVEWGDDCAFT